MLSELERVIREQRTRLAAMDAEARARMRLAYEQAIDRITRELDATVRALEAFPGPEWRQYHERRLRTLLDLAEAEYARFSDEAATILQAEQAQAVRGGAQSAQEMMAATGQSVGFGVAVNAPAMERLVASFAPGSPLRDVLQSYGDYGRKVIERELTDALAGGTSPREASREIRRRLGSGAVKARIDSLTRTELMRSFRGSLSDQYAGMGFRFKVRVAAFSPRTCLACISTHGDIYPVWQEMESHVNCRCTWVPWSAKNVDTLEVVGSGEEWLRRQDPERIRPMFPTAEAHGAWERGDVPLSAFVGVHEDQTWGSSIHVRSWRDVKRRVNA